MVDYEYKSDNEIDRIQQAVGNDSQDEVLLIFDSIDQWQQGKAPGKDKPGGPEMISCKKDTVQYWSPSLKFFAALLNHIYFKINLKGLS